MPRLHFKNNRGRQATQTTPRLLKTKDISDHTYQEPASRRQKASRVSKYTTTVQQNKRRRAAAAATSDSDASEDSDADDASDEQSDDDDEDCNDEDGEPALFAPSQLEDDVGMGLKINANYYGADRQTSVESMFPLPRIGVEGDEFPSAEAALAYERDFFAQLEDDDQAYEDVNDISDSDDDEREHYEEEQLIADMDDEELQESDMLNHIEGMSEYGFGDDSEDGTVIYPPSSHDSDAADAAHQRHVRFDTDALLGHRLSESPTFSRSLLPSALPAIPGLFVGSEDHQASSSDDEDYDSDATDDCLPPEAQMSQEQQPADPTTKPKSPAIEPIDAETPYNGPKWGHFIDNGDKASGILDATGKIMLITHPHLLGDEFVRRRNDSAHTSPGNHFEEVFDGSDIVSTPDNMEIAPLGNVPAMVDNLNTSRAMTGMTNGLQEIFMPANFNVAEWDTGFDSDGDIINMDDVINMDDDSDSDDATINPAHMFPPPRTPASAHQHISSLNSNTVTAFRRSADPNFATFRTTPSFSRLTDLSSPLAPASRKRKASNESPYASPHYAGVTPVQRMSADEHAQTNLSTPDTVRNKRQRIMTA